MPEYEIITKKTIEYVYRKTIDPPVDMGPANERICDRFARQIAKNGEIPNVEADQVDDTAAEEIAFIFRDNQQIWPRLRKNQAVKEKPDKRQLKIEDAFNTGATEEEGGDEE